jgi:hypothetical protein
MGIRKSEVFPLRRDYVEIYRKRSDSERYKIVPKNRSRKNAFRKLAISRVPVTRFACLLENQQNLDKSLLEDAIIVCCELIGHEILLPENDRKCNFSAKNNVSLLFHKAILVTSY